MVFKEIEQNIRKEKLDGVYYDQYGFDGKGFHKDGYDIYGFDEKGSNKDGYDIYGFDEK